MKKRILSFALVLCMVLTLLPASAFAEGDSTRTFSELPTGVTSISMVAEETLGENISAIADEFVVFCKDNNIQDGEILLFDCISGEDSYHSWIVTIDGDNVTAVDGGYTNLLGALELINNRPYYKELWICGTYEHTHSYTAVVTDPTCTEQGYTTYTCSCGDSYVDNYVDALGHNYVDGQCTRCEEWSEDIVDHGTCGANLTWTLDSEGTLTISGTGEMTSNPWRDNYSDQIKTVVIEDGVTSIGDGAFMRCYSLTSVTIGNSVTSIGDSAFSGCSSLTSITLPYSVASIGWGAFDNCTSLKDVYYNGSLESWLKIHFENYFSNPCYYIGANLYFNGKLVTAIDIPDSVTSIRDYAFNGCTSLTSVVIPDSVTSIGDGAFNWCSSLKDVFYEGSQAQWSEINLGSDCLPSGIRMHYNIDDVSTHGEYIKTVEPTCTTGGYDLYSCSCESGYYWMNYVPALGHDYDEDGICTVCGMTQDGKQAFFVHVGNIATYSMNLNEELESPVWRSSDSSIIRVDSSDKSAVIINNYYYGTYSVSVTALKNGKATLSFCDDSTGRVISSTTIKVIDHNYVVEKTVEPTCTDKGYTTYTCDCGASYKDNYVDALGHDYGDWKVIKAATETEKGVETRYCSRCDATETRDITPIGHTHSYTSVVTAPTCTDKGYTTYTCSCGDSYKDNYVEALGYDHDYVDGKCTRCGATDPNYKPETLVNPFVDVSESAVYYDAILWAVENNITAGVDATHFSPNANCTRGQVVTFLWRAAGCPEPTGTCPFVDVKSSSPYYKAIIWAAEQGITNGFDATHFAPNATVTRAQFVTFLWRYEGKPAANGTINFADASSIAKPYQEAVAWAVGEGVTAGYADGTFRPTATCTRWAVVLLMYRDLA